MNMTDSEQRVLAAACERLYPPAVPEECMDVSGFLIALREHTQAAVLAELEACYEAGADDHAAYGIGREVFFRITELREEEGRRPCSFV